MQKHYLPARKPEGVRRGTWSHFWTSSRWVWESISLYGTYPEEVQVFCVCETLLVITAAQIVCSVLLFYTVSLMKEPQQFMKEMLDSVKCWLFCMYFFNNCNLPTEPVSFSSPPSSPTCGACSPGLLMWLSFSWQEGLSRIWNYHTYFLFRNGKKVVCSRCFTHCWGMKAKQRAKIRTGLILWQRSFSTPWKGGRWKRSKAWVCIVIQASSNSMRRM